MGIILFAIVGGAIAYFGGVRFDMYEAFGPNGPYIGAAIGAAAAALIALALKPRREAVYRGPALDQ